MEDRRTKKKEVWQKMTKLMTKRGYNVSTYQVENKWNNLVKSHKDIQSNKRTSGGKRKTFQYFKEMDEILLKRHDINPPFTDGTKTSNHSTSKRYAMKASKPPMTTRPTATSSPKDKTRKDDEDQDDENTVSDTSLNLSSGRMTETT